MLEWLEGHALLFSFFIREGWALFYEVAWAWDHPDTIVATGSAVGLPIRRYVIRRAVIDRYNARYEAAKQALRKVAMYEMSADAAAAPGFEEKAFFEYHLYTLGRPTTIGDNQTKQVAMLSGGGIPVVKEYRFVNIGTAYNYPMGDMARANATVRMAFDNKESDHLGMPLPKGTVRVYKNDSAGQALFVGEDAIDHTPKGETVHLNLGQAFDVTAQPRQTEFEKLSDRVFEAAFEIEVKNAKKEPVTVTVREFVPGDWKMLEESVKHEKVDSSTAEWHVNVPAEGSAKLTYKVRITF
jgi:hypothetical protein